MQYGRKLKEGELIEVGDLVCSEESFFGTRYWKVHRCTPKYAFVEWNDEAEGKFLRTIPVHQYIRLVIGSDSWSTAKYTVCRRVKEEVIKEGNQL